MTILRTPLTLLITGISGAWQAAQEEVRHPSERVGLVLMVLSAASFALMAALAKKLLPQTPTQAVVFSRGVMMSVVFIALAWTQRVPLIGKQPWTLLGRGLLGYGALSCYFYSVQHLPLGDAVLIQYSHPIAVAAIAPFVLGELTGRWHWPLVVIALAGVGLIVGPSGDLRGQALIGVLGSFLSGWAYIAVRRLSRSEHPLTILVWFPVVSIPLSLVALWRDEAVAWPRTTTEWLGHLAVTAAALVGQWTLTMGLARAGAARATAVTMTGPAFGMVFGWLMFGAVPSWLSLVGTAIACGAIVALAWNRPPPH